MVTPKKSAKSPKPIKKKKAAPEKTKARKRTQKPKESIKTPIKPDADLNKTAENDASVGEKAENTAQKYERLLSCLSDRAARFVQEYLVDLTKEKAAERAGYSPKSARQQAFVLMKNPTVCAAIAAGKRVISERTMVTYEKCINELALIGFADMADFIRIDEGGSVTAIPLDQMAEGKSRIIKKIKERRIIKSCQGTKDHPSEDVILESTLEYELSDKVKSLQILTQHVSPEPAKLEVVHNMTAMPPSFASMTDWAEAYKRMVQDCKKEGDK